MSQYTSTRQGFERAMKWSLTGPPEDAKLFAESTATPTFYQIMNGQRIAYDIHIEGIATWRAKVCDYKPSVYVHISFFTALMSLNPELISNIQCAQ